MKEQAKKTEAVIEQQNPVMMKKVEQLVIKQISKLSYSTSDQSETLQNIS